jgi:thymidylate synthase
MHQEYQYIFLIRKIIAEGVKRKGRNGTTISLFGPQLRFSLKDNTIPILTTKKLAWKTCFKELTWFINGHTDNKLLQEQNVKIWNGNASKEFLESRGLDYEENDLGPVYGHQWRHFNAPYSTSKADYTGQGVDQLKYVIDALKNSDENSTKENRYSRRLVVSAWNPCQIDEMALPPCHIMFQFYVNGNDELSCSMYQRSGDVGLGVPFNIASYSFLTHIIADMCGLKAGEFVYTIGDCHIYDDHIDALLEQVQRQPFEFPKIQINKRHENINDYTVDDVSLLNYQYHKTVKMDMRV